MFKKGDKVMYGTYGMCVVVETNAHLPSARPASPGEPEQTYYVLAAESQRGGRAYVPKDREGLIRRAVTKDEARGLLDGFSLMEPDLFEDKNIHAVEDHFRAILRQHDCREALRVILTMRMRIGSQQAAGHKPSEVYLRLLKDAESQVCGELAFALGVSEDDVEMLLRGQNAQLNN